MNLDDAVMDLAEVQHGAAGRWQIRDLGGDHRWVGRRVASGQWHAATARVLVRAGAPCTPKQALMVSVLDAGRGAFASHRAAAWNWRVPSFDHPSDDVVRPRAPGVAPTASRLHRPRLWLPDHVVSVDGIPCASLPLTIFQLAGCEPLGRMAVIVDQIVTKSPAMLRALHALLEIYAERGRPGITVMRTLLDERPVGSKVPASGNERRFETLVANAGEPPFERQVDVGGHSWLGRCDHRCPETGLLVEIQSELHHTSVTDMARDARREAELLAAGHPKVLFIWDDQLWRRPWEVAPAVRAARDELRHLARRTA